VWEPRSYHYPAILPLHAIKRQDTSSARRYASQASRTRQGLTFSRYFLSKAMYKKCICWERQQYITVVHLLYILSLLYYYPYYYTCTTTWLGRGRTDHIWVHRSGSPSSWASRRSFPRGRGSWAAWTPRWWSWWPRRSSPRCSSTGERERERDRDRERERFTVAFPSFLIRRKPGTALPRALVQCSLRFLHI